MINDAAWLYFEFSWSLLSHGTVKYVSWFFVLFSFVFCLVEVSFVTVIFLILLTLLMIIKNSLHRMDAYPYVYILNTDFLPVLPLVIFFLIFKDQFLRLAVEVMGFITCPFLPTLFIESPLWKTTPPSFKYIQICWPLYFFFKLWLSCQA